MRRVEKGDELSQVMFAIQIGLAIARQAMIVEKILERGMRPCPLEGAHCKPAALLRGGSFDVEEILALVEGQRPGSLLLQGPVKTQRGSLGQHVRDVDAPRTGEFPRQRRAIKPGVELRRCVGGMEGRRCAAHGAIVRPFLGAAQDSDDYSGMRASSAERMAAMRDEARSFTLALLS